MTLILCSTTVALNNSGLISTTEARYASVVTGTKNFTLNFIDSSAVEYKNLILDTCGGSSGDTSAVAIDTYDLPVVAVPTKDNCVFNGYWTEAEGGTQIYGANGVSVASYSDLPTDGHLYAHWNQVQQ